MTTVDFIARLNDAEKGWGLWIDRDNPEQHHVGQYAFENDRMPRNFIHVASLNRLAHLRQVYILNQGGTPNAEETLGREWAEQFMREWQSLPV
ncbi:hypothetical protein [Oscillatoria sp. FACHB-1406]|uniref:hypothetical protein n=1 Tax=Oscillatoria sp. FACHB-1406 TaxID=2692846 RepID=UPI0016853DA6|nr:hypothetical protein [Oscillatoria sp. FACHB-1406]MBD2576809.1 hypothetical protein [Oscillatoria sp. FACHB-1406]